MKGAWLWAIAGALAGLMMTACMFVLRILTGAPTLPQLFQDQVLALLPGTLFSFVLDRLQFAAKPAGRWTRVSAGAGRRRIGLVGRPHLASASFSGP